MIRSVTILTVLAASWMACGSLRLEAADLTLAGGGMAGHRRAAGSGALPDDGRFALRQRLMPGGIRLSPELPIGRPLPRAVGDSLVISLDDGLPPIAGDWEARLDLSGGIAGVSDAVAVRFSASSLAVAPPFDVASVIVGLDDRHGATTWPVELWLEDASNPLQPRQGTVSATGLLDAVAAGLAPSGSTGDRPTDFQRLAVPLRVRVPDAWLSDGAFDDDFARTAVPLGDADWVECEGVSCGTLNVFLSGGQAVRQTGGGPLLAVRYPSIVQEAQRPHRDIDVRASVRVNDAAASYRRAGLALRVLAVDAFYRVEYQKTPSQVVVTAVLPAPLGEVPVGAPLPVSTPSSGSRLLEVTVTGASPSVRFDVSVDGASVGSVVDPTHRLTGWYSGLSASDPAGQGEAWDDFRVERRPDVFAVIGFPPGEDVGLPLDVSDFSLASQSILASTDGVTFAPLGTTLGCAQPGNPFVQLEVEDTVSGSVLFQREARVTAVGLSCPTCPTGPSSCARNAGLGERNVPTLVTGETVTARVRWWNEHLADDTLLFRGSLWSGPCDAPGSLLASATVTGLSSAGQGTATTSEANVLDFTPAATGPHCLTIEELHDSNRDCCPDGEETTPLGTCGGTCTPIASTDSQGATRWTLVDLFATAPCAFPKGEDVGRDGPDDLDLDGVRDEINLDGASLRVARAAGEGVVLTWGRHDPAIFPAIHNVHVLDGATLSRAACFLDQAPVAFRVVGAETTLLDLPVRPGHPAWLAVHETDGCASGASVPDDSADDPALGCP